jgi:phage shock protein B
VNGSTALFFLALVLLTIVVPTALALHYSTKWKSMKGLSDEEQRTLENLWQDSERMADRINALETILDDEVPGWRSRT